MLKLCLRALAPLGLAFAAAGAHAQAWPVKLYRDDFEKYGRLVKDLSIKVN